MTGCSSYVKVQIKDQDRVVDQKGYVEKNSLFSSFIDFFLSVVVHNGRSFSQMH